MSVVCIVRLYLHLTRTKLGFATRSIMTDSEKALTTGINIDRVSMIALVIGLSLAGLAGVFAL